MSIEKTIVIVGISGIIVIVFVTCYSIALMRIGLDIEAEKTNQQRTQNIIECESVTGNLKWCLDNFK